MTDSDEEISIFQNSKNYTGMRKLRLRNKTIPHNITINFTL